MKITPLIFTLLAFNYAIAQNPDDLIRAKGVPQTIMLKPGGIAGAPVFTKATLIRGTQQDIRTEKHGLAYPAFFDWNHDGKPDLLLGEFETGQKGSNVKVYLNQGTVKNPKYSGKYFYALDANKDTITNYQWCCIGIHPKMVDLDQDGYPDMLSGQYNPGQISWWRGSKNGFMPRQFVPQQGYKEGEMNGNFDELDPRSNDYWNYSSAGFADFDGDGLTDLFVGGFGELKVALNIGTKAAPKFGLRKYLLGIDGLPLSVVKPSEQEVDKALKQYKLPHYAGAYKTFISPVDWDGDGVLDLLVTHLYGNRKTKDPVVFFRGVQTDKGLRFEEAKPLFTGENMYKTFPGCQPNITITDYNQDGVPDLVIGVSIPTLNGFEVDSLTSWGYLNDFGIEAPGKDAGLAIKWDGGIENLKKKLNEKPELKSYYLGKFTDEKYLTLRHRGFVYVLLGKKNTTKSIPLKNVVAAEEVKAPLNETAKAGGSGSVTYTAKAPALVGPYKEEAVEVELNFEPDWYGYADTKTNVGEGWIPTKVEYAFPRGFELVGEPFIPPTQLKGPTEVYKGKGIKFSRKFRIVPYNHEGKVILKPGQYEVLVTLQYQTCNQERCLPPVEEKITLKVNYNDR